MKVLWVAHRDPSNPRAGGAERIIFEVCTRLSKNGHEITVIAGGWKNCKRYEDLDRIHIMRYGYRAGPHFALPLLLMKNRFDVVIADLGHAVPWISPVLLRRRVIVHFLHLHARSLPGQVGWLLAKTITSIEKLYPIIYNKQHFVTISGTSFDDLIGLGIKRGKISIIYPGVDADIFHPGKKTDYPSMVYFGGMRPYKRPEEALYILKELKRDFMGLRLFVIGDGPSKSKMENLSKELDVDECVSFTGRVSYEKVAEIVASSWVNIHSSVTEGWGISIVEASSAGTPTIAYKVSGVSDSIQDGINGILVKDADRNALANAAKTIISNPEKWWSSSVEVAKKYSWDRTAELWEILIKQVAGEQS